MCEIGEQVVVWLKGRKVSLLSSDQDNLENKDGIIRQPSSTLCLNTATYSAVLGSSGKPFVRLGRFERLTAW